MSRFIHKGSALNEKRENELDFLSLSALVSAGCTRDAVPHMKVPPCVCSDWAVQIQSDQPQAPQLPSSRPSMTPASRSEERNYSYQSMCSHTQNVMAHDHINEDILYVYMGFYLFLSLWN